MANKALRLLANRQDRDRNAVIGRMVALRDEFSEIGNTKAEKLCMEIIDKLSSLGDAIFNELEA